MEYDKIIIDLMNRIVTLEERVSLLEKSGILTKTENVELPSGSKKYRFLSDYLHESNQSRVKLTYTEIEDILKFKLPNSATTHRAFWANTTTHSIALSWLSVNYEVVEVNIEKQYIVFERKRDFEKLTINEQMRIVVEELISEYGLHYKVNLKEIYEMVGLRFGTNVSSIIPSDFCYNRTNKGIDFVNKPRLFEFLGEGMYKCLGTNYPYNGDVYACNKGATEDIKVGCWVNGEFHKNDNWDLYCEN